MRSVLRLCYATLGRMFSVGAVVAMAACAPEAESPAIETAFVNAESVELRRELAPNSPVIATLPKGDQVSIVGRRRRFVRVRTAGNVEGWTKDSELITPEIRDLMEQLRKQTLSDPGQGEVRAFHALNVHLEPYRWSRTIYQLQEEEGAELLRHEVIDRLPARGQRPPPGSEPLAQDDWYLVRLASGQPGWLLATGVYAAIPIEVAQYAERKRITSYFALGEVADKARNVTKKTWLWTQISRPKQPYDFDLFRVFLWSRGRGAYQTVKLERGLQGYLPVLIHPNMTTRYGIGPGFSVTVEAGGERVQRTYVLVGQRVYRVGEAPAPPARAPIRLLRDEPRPQPPATLLERLTGWWQRL